MSAEIIAFTRATVSPALSQAARIADAMSLLSMTADDVAALAYGVPHPLADRADRERRFAQLLDLLAGD